MRFEEGGALTKSCRGAGPLVAVLLGAVTAVAGVGLTAGWPGGGEVEGALKVGVEAPMTAMDLGVRRAVTSPVVARDPTTPQFVVAATRTDTPGPDCGLHASGDGAASWLPVQVFDGPPAGVQACYAPQVGFDAAGRLVFAFVGMAGPPPHPVGVWAGISNDHAQTFTQPRKLAEVATTAISLAVAGDAVHLAWLQPPDGGSGGQDDGWPVGEAVVVASGPVAGELNPPVQLAASGSGGLVAGPVVAAAPDGGVAVGFWQLPDEATTGQGAGSLLGAGPWRLLVAHRPAGSTAFREPVVVAQRRLPPVESRAGGHPELVTRRGVAPPGLTIDAARVCASWTALGGTAGLDALVACTEQGHGRWGQPVKLGDSLAGETFQWLPQIALSGTGRLDAVFYHHRQQADDGRAADTYYTTTRDLEDGFTRPVRVSSQSSLPHQGPLPGWFGTHLGLHSGPHGAVVAWADSRNGMPTARPSQTVFSATIPPPPAGGVPAWTAGVLVAIGSAGTAAGLWWRHARRHRDDGDGSHGAPSDRQAPHGGSA